MQNMNFGHTGIQVSKQGFGCLPIQRVSFDEAKLLLNRALDGGINFFDTARAYSDSEEKVGYSISSRRSEYTLATKTHSSTAEEFRTHLETSLRNLKTDCIDIYQFHNPSFIPKPDGEDGLYRAAVKAREEGKIRFIGITQHSIERAEQIVESGLFDTLQYPFNHLATQREIALVKRCKEKGMGFIAMKALSGGLITDARAPYTFIGQFDGAVPIWGFQHMWEVEQILRFAEEDVQMTDEIRARIEKDQKELTGAFCRGCGYCMPCPVGIQINNCNRMTQLLGRAVYQNYLSEEWKQEMEKITACIHCGKCAKHCPYDLKPFETLPKHLEFYRTFAKEHASQCD